MKYKNDIVGPRQHQQDRTPLDRSRIVFKPLPTRESVGKYAGYGRQKEIVDI